jgi:CheY-like chemotaxis protein
MILEKREFHLKNIFYSVENIFSFEIRSKGLEFTLEISKDIPARIIADELRIRQILINLISNAMKFTEKGGITLKAHLKKSIKTDPEYAAIEISVTDTGCGIPEDKQDLIFSKFQQSDMSISRKFGGTGLGLSIVSELVKLMYGNISVKSEPGKGSEFTFWIIVKKSESKIDNIKEKTAMDKNFTGIKPLNILLAEDNETNILLAATVLKKLGHSVNIARNGIEVLDKMKKKNFDLIFMDIEMPELDGIETTKKIRGGECGNDKKNIPIISMSAHVLAEIKQKAMDSGMNDFITKPIDITRIQEKIDKVTGG